MTRLSVLLWIACLCSFLATVRAQNFTAVSNVDANFQVSIAYDFTLATPAVFTQRCTGAILSDVWVITSASCVCPGGLRTCDDDLNRWRVRFGSSSLNSAISLGIARIEIHPQWNGIFPNGFDVALFRLTGSVNSLRADMRPLGLPTSVEWSCAGNSGIAGVYTWGSAGLVNQLVMTPAVILTDWVIVTTNLIVNQVRQQFDKLFSFTQCQMNPNCVPQGIAVRYTDNNIGLCPTDTGAPLVLTQPNGQRVLIGLGSYRFSGSGIQVNPNQPCIENFVNGTVVNGRVPIVFQQIDVVSTWIRGLIANAVAIGSVCGDGLIGYGEQCDDGNVFSGDGCSNACLLEQDWLCTPARARWIRDGEDSDDDHHRFRNWIIQVNPLVDFCGQSRCIALRHDDDDDGSSGSIIALAIALPVSIAVALCCLIAWCLYMRSRRNKQKKEVVVEEAVIAPAPIPFTPITAPAAPPSTPDVSPVMMEIVSPAYGLGTSEVMPPIIQRENILQAPIIEQTNEVGVPTWLQ